MKNIDKYINSFIKKYNLLKEPLTLPKVRKIIESQGFQIIYYNHFENSEEVETLLNVLDIKYQSLHTQCFIYADRENRFVFVYDDLCEEDERLLLLHEEAHIYLEHSFKTGFLKDTNVQKENEANYFMLQIPDRVEEIKHNRSFKAVFTLAVLITLAFIIGITLFFGYGKAKVKTDSASFTGNPNDTVYVTEAGEKYHRDGCFHITDKDPQSLIRQKAEDLGYSPCMDCNP